MGSSWYHEIDGVLYPRVTSILDTIQEPGLYAWRTRVGDRQADRIAARTASVGTKVHALIDATLRTGKLAKCKSKVADVQAAWECWKGWYGAQGGKLEGQGERLMVSKAFGYSGTPDFVESTPTLKRITDWKITGRIREKHWIQLHAYVPLVWPLLDDEDSVRLRIVRIDPKVGLPDVDEREFDRAVFATFMDLVSVYRNWFWFPRLDAMKAAAAEALAQPLVDLAPVDVPF